MKICMIVLRIVGIARIAEMNAQIPVGMIAVIVETIVVIAAIVEMIVDEIYNHIA